MVHYTFFFYFCLYLKIPKEIVLIFKKMSSIECFRSKNIIYLTNSLVHYWFFVTLNCILGNACDGEEGNIKG